MGRFQLPLSSAHYEAIGRVTAAAVGLEYAIEQVIWAQLRLDMEHGTAVTAQLGFNNRIQLLQTLGNIQIADSDELEIFKKTLKQIRALETKRNKIVHALWVSSEKVGNPIAYKVTARGRIKSQLRELSVEQISEVTDEMLQLAGDMLDMITPPQTR